MTRRSWMRLAAAAIVAVAIAAVALMRGGKGEAEADPAPTATVTLAAVQSLPLEDVISVYGVVAADPAGAITVAAPKAAIIARMLVRSGQAVAAGQALVELADAPGAELAYRQAADAAAFARTDLARVQRLYEARLAASDQLNAARKALADAEAALAAQQKQGAGRVRQVLTAPRAAIVTTVSAASGDHVAQDAPILVLARSDAAVARLALEPSSPVAVGQAVVLHPVFGGPPIRSKISMVGQAADQATRTLDAVAPLNGAALPIGAALRGDVVTGARAGLIAPRAAVVFDETGPHLFTVSGGKAHRVFVTVGRDREDGIEIRGEVAPGAQVAVEGAYELQDGMAVKVRR